ncbi:MAG: transposase, partial [Gammaproteobacteria bacterium]
HTRREFVKAENHEPDAVAEALELIGALYRVEARIRDKKMNLAEALACRAAHAKPAVDGKGDGGINFYSLRHLYP